MERTVKAALLVVDLQRYYLESQSSFYAYSSSQWPGSMDYISERYEHSLVPGIGLLKETFRRLSWPVVYLRLCGVEDDRSDLHRFFMDFHVKAEKAGYAGAYPLADEPMAAIAPAVAPEAGDEIVRKTGFSGFTNGALDLLLRSKGVGSLVMAGLATSQCVDTTARDGSDRGYSIAFAEDCLADYSADFHESALYASIGVCGGHIHTAAWLAENPQRLLELR
jgi:nicotinamidase-related amidase